MSKEKGNAFSAASAALGGSINDIFNDVAAEEGVQFLWLSTEDILVVAQIREQFEDDENSLADLAASIKEKGVMQPILVRPAEFGRYELVAGERRLRASKMAGKLTIPAIIKELTDEEADDAQLAENIHRKNLTQIEEAKKIQRDLDKLGNVEAVLAKHNKSKSWLSKTLTLLNLPEQAKRLVTENISADSEVITQVKTIEKIDPVKAKTLVDDLKKTRGKEDAREKVSAAKDEVKPSKTPKVARVEAKGKDPAKAAEAPLQMATPREREFQQPSAPMVSVFPTQQPKKQSVEEQILSDVYAKTFVDRLPLDEVMKDLSADDKAIMDKALRPFFADGKEAVSVCATVMSNLRSGVFGVDGAPAMSFLAFLQGVEKLPAFDLAIAVNAVKA